MENTSILILGAGELGMPVIRNIEKKAKNYSNVSVTVLLSEATISSEASELIAIFKNYDAVVPYSGQHEVFPGH
jgi:hypothetical protein